MMDLEASSCLAGTSNQVTGDACIPSRLCLFYNEQEVGGGGDHGRCCRGRHPEVSSKAAQHGRDESRGAGNRQHERHRYRCPREAP